MTVLKHNEAATKASSAVVLDLSDLGEQALRLLDNARTEAKQIVADARIDAARMRTEAHEQGRAEGTKQGEREGAEQGATQARQEILDTFKPQLEQITESWDAALQNWEQQRSEMLLQAREDVLTFAFDLAAKVLGRAIEHDASLVQEQLAAALQLLNQPTALTVAVHPDDQPLVQDVLPTLLQQITTCAHAEVVTDDAISRGGCIVRTAGGNVDATIETQLQRLAEALLPRRPAHEPPETE